MGGGEGGGGGGGGVLGAASVKQPRPSLPPIIDRLFLRRDSCNTRMAPSSKKLNFKGSYSYHVHQPLQQFF